MADSSEGYVFNSPAGIGNSREPVTVDHDSLRLTRYSKNWQFYMGQMWTFTREDGEPLVTVNYLRTFIDKKVAFLLGNDFTSTVPAPLTNITLPVIQKAWEQSGRQALNFEIAQEGHVTGDIFLLVTTADATPDELKFNPEAPKRIIVQRLNSAECFPEFDETVPPTKYGLKIGRFTILRSIRRPNPNRKGQEVVKWEMTITEQEIAVRLVRNYGTKDEEVISEDVQPNDLGEIPIVHIKNKVSAHTIFGLDECVDMINLNREYNEKSTDISDTINYNSAPVTIITGAKAKNLERGPRAIWSGLPSDAKVVNLKLEGELTAAVSYLERIKLAMHEVAQVPEAALVTPAKITGASGETLNAQLAPMVDERNKKKATYEPGFERVNYFILRYAELFWELGLPFGLCNKCGGKIAYEDIEDPQDPGETIRIKRCYVYNPETDDFMHPDDMKVPYLRVHSFGNELAQITPAQAATEHGHDNASYYDPAPKTATDPDNVNQIPGITLPAEPVELDLPEHSLTTADGQKIPVQAERKVTVIPLECNEHSYLNPYTNWVTFNETLPKDKKAQADLFTLYNQLAIVSRRWMMEQIGVEDIDTMQLEIRQEKAADFAALSAMNAQDQQQQAQIQQQNQPPDNTDGSQNDGSQQGSKQGA